MKNTLIVIAGLTLAVAGFMVGRAYPVHAVHHYARLFDGPFLFDASTGKACNPLRDAQDKAWSTNAAMDKKVTLDSSEAPIDLSAGLVPPQKEPRYSDIPSGATVISEPPATLPADFFEKHGSASLDDIAPRTEVHHVGIRDTLAACGSE
jgi:hypothetical protein